MPDIQRAVEELAERLGCAVLVEDAGHHPLWWSAQDEGDPVRLRSIMRREPPPEAAALVRRLGLARATGPVRTPALPEADMVERWCVPVREGERLHGYLWVLDPHGAVSQEEIGPAVEVAGLAAGILARTEPDAAERARLRTELLARLRAGRDVAAAEELADLQHLSRQVTVAVSTLVGTRADRRGWTLGDGLTAHPDPGPTAALTSGPPVPLADLSVAVSRAVATRRALRAGARLARPTWDALGSWHLIVAAPDDLSPGQVHPGADVLRGRRRGDLLLTARCVLDHGGDVTRSAEELHIHRTTLYYRLDRIEALTGVNLRLADGRDDLHLALRLAAYRDTR